MTAESVDGHGDSSLISQRTSGSGRKTRKLPPRLPLLLKRKAAAKLCGFSLPTWDRMSAAGLNPAGLKIGGGRMYRTAELVAWVRTGCPRRPHWEILWKTLQKRSPHN